MVSPNRQAMDLLQEQRKRRKRTVVFLCMAAVVVIATAVALRVNGRAKNNMVLDCALTHTVSHQHVAECYFTPSQEGGHPVQVCGMADYTVHTHDPEACYDKDGALACPLPEVEEHIHSESCYTQRQELACTLEETPGHQHTEACYGLSELPACGLEEAEGHAHTEECYDEEGFLLCELEEAEGHIHDEGCYGQVLLCGMEEGEGAHAHTESCYVTIQEVVCGKPAVEVHTHTEACYLHSGDQVSEEDQVLLADRGIDLQVLSLSAAEHTQGEDTRLTDRNGRPVFVCRKLQTEAHIHGDNCYEAIGPDDELPSQAEDSSDGVGLPGQRSAVYQDGTLKATALYKGEDFPENASLSIQRVDEAERLQEKQEQMGRLLEDEGLQLKALLRVSLNGEEIAALAEPVELTIELGEDPQGGLAAAAWQDGQPAEPLENAVQASGQSVTLLEISLDEEGRAISRVVPGSVVGIGLLSAEEEPVQPEETGKPDVSESPAPAPTAAPVKDVRLQISQSFSYEDEDYDMVFHVEGVARAQAQIPTAQEAGNEDAALDEGEPAAEKLAVEPVVYNAPEAGEEGLDQPEETDSESGSDWEEDASLPEEDGQEGEDPAQEESTDMSGDDSQAEAEEPVATAEPQPTVEPIPQETAAPVVVTIAGDTLPANVLDDPQQPLGLLVEPVGEGTPTYDLYAAYAQEDNSGGMLPGLKVMAYKIYYNGTELDLTRCTVTLEVSAKAHLVEKAAEVEEEQGAGPESTGDGMGVTMAAIVPVETVAEEPQPEENVYVMPAGDGESVPVGEEEKLLDMINENVSEDTPVSAKSAVPLREGEATVRMVLRTAVEEESFEEEESGEEDASADDSEAAEDVDGDESAGDNAGADGSGNLPDNSFGMLVISAANPRFKVQYYAWMNRIKLDSEGGTLNVIDTANPQGSNRDNYKEVNGGVLPVNGTGANSPTGRLKRIHLVEKEGDPERGKVINEKKLERVYTQVDSTYIQRPNLKYFAPQSNTDDFYTLRQVWVLRKTKSDATLEEQEERAKQAQAAFDAATTPTDRNRVVHDYWTVYGTRKTGFGDIEPDHLLGENGEENFDEITKYLHFTNREEVANDEAQNQAGHRYVQITNNDIVRLIYNPTEGKKDIDSNFYDYDITEGNRDNPMVTNDATKTDEASLEASAKGINNPANYGDDADSARYAFGNAQMGTGLGGQKWNSTDMLNMANNRSYGGCTFGLVTGVEKGTVTFAEGVAGPKIFGEEEAIGKTVYSGGNNKVTFKREGDTYTLTAATVGESTISNLDYFGYIKPNWNGTRMMYSNEFWMLDKVPEQNRKDTLFGVEPNVSVSGWNYVSKDDSYQKAGVAYPSDHGIAHNSFFGMNFSVNFELTSEYAGPLEYLFFGDDDMWVFLTPLTGSSANTSKLVCDIGGVHPSVGEYVNLWDYIKADDFEKNNDYVVSLGDNEKHEIAKYRLDFFYTERGASGSACWMQYTLPSVRSATSSLTEKDYSGLSFKKEVTRTMVDGSAEGEPEDFDTAEEFLFKITLNDEDGNALRDDFQYTRYDKDNNPIKKPDNSDDPYASLLYGEVLHSGAYFTLKKGETINIAHLPIGAKFTIEELGVFDKVEERVDENGKLVYYYKTKPGQYDYEVSAKVDGVEADMNDRTYEGVILADNQDISLEFNNNFKSFQLPETGGFGPLVFAGAGGVLMVSAGFLLGRKRKHRR